jgi:predicted nucleic acid-binding protein
LIVVSDTSPILNLFAVGRLNLLQHLYQQLVIAPAVSIELHRNGFDHASEEWLVARRPTNAELLKRLSQQLDPGEAEAIVIAVELRADRILIDERRARRIASELELRPVGLLGVLAEAKHRGILQECKPLLDEMIDTAGFWISERLRARFLTEIGETSADSKP